MERNCYENRQRSLLFVFVRFFSVDRPQNTEKLTNRNVLVT